MKKITIYKISKPEVNDINKELQWFSESLGLFGIRDKERSCFRVFLELVKAKKSHRFISSDEIANNSRITRATVIHHLKNLEERGLIIHENKRYSLSMNSFSSLIKQMEKDFQKLIEDLEETANELDNKLELN